MNTVETVKEVINTSQKIEEIANQLLTDRKRLTACLKRILELMEHMNPKSTAEVIIDDIIDTMKRLS